ncbi:MAG: hypothetical protein AMDU5_GPLC00019G0027 [Thermoplasmatales archaeon Gpl]|jgi:hypothetical protein|nr:MAG: hypothetical protein AMDU5_GPLC00019G0027 [Thermoplasmatales archaeon Gpl]
MKKSVRLVVTVLIVLIFTTSGIYIYNSFIKPYFNCYISAQSNCVESGNGTNITITINPYDGAKFASSDNSQHFLLYYVGNQTVKVGDHRLSTFYDENVYTMALNCTKNYRQLNGVTPLCTSIAVKKIKGDTETSISVKWNGTIIEYQGNLTSKAIYEPAIPGNYALVPYLYICGVGNTESSAKNIQLTNYIIHVKGLQLVNKSKKDKVSEEGCCIGNLKHSVAQVSISSSFYNISSGMVYKMTYDNFTIGCKQTVNLNTLNSTELNEPKYNNIKIFTEVKMIWDNLTFQWGDESFFIK